MEEARQHPPLTGEQRAFVAVYFGGLLALLAGILALLIDTRFFWFGALAWMASRAIIPIWQLAHPDATSGEPAPKWKLVPNLIGWSAIFVLFFFYGGLK